MAKTNADQPKDLASQLLEAEVGFWLQNLKGKKFQALLADELNHVLARLEHIRLRDAVDESKVKATARRYAVEMEIGGAIPELFGEIANRIFEFPASRTTKIGEVVSDSIATEFIEKIFEQNGVLDHAVTNIRNSTPFRHFLSDVIFTVLKGYVFEQNNLMKFSTVASSTRKVREWLSTKAPDLSEGLEERVRNLMESGVKGSLEMVDETLDNEQYRETAMNSALAFWDVVREWPLTAYRDYLTEQDLQEFMVLGYEFWLEFRNTEYLKSCIDLGVDFFFEKYGEQSLQDLLDDIGISHEMITDELDNYIPDLAALLIKEGLAESFLRRNLQRFYSSKKVQDLLAE
ncbi:MULTISPECIES: hypothetical protein [unclassified Limnobacter]|uniref:hypothetical protein n=1 Tax=unclassified Limnobacter TaxID=2630203 RepID=UPI000C63DF60|nr:MULTISPECIES: hypothetical protein [unclassified Limnobacter]MAG80940.1 hypothetical protein [Sutterellaceae bacterium]|tara:strand:- start:15623 stop:16660 length:1038 start_codon:yes stop_codon:yes gene_type:complete